VVTASDQVSEPGQESPLIGGFPLGDRPT